MDYQIKNIKDEILVVENVVPKSFQQAIIAVVLLHMTNRVNL